MLLSPFLQLAHNDSGLKQKHHHRFNEVEIPGCKPIINQPIDSPLTNNLTIISPSLVNSRSELNKIYAMNTKNWKLENLIKQVKSSSKRNQYLKSPTQFVLPKPKVLSRVHLDLKVKEITTIDRVNAILMKYNTTDQLEVNTNRGKESNNDNKPMHSESRSKNHLDNKIDVKIKIKKRKTDLINKEIPLSKRILQVARKSESDNKFLFNYND